MFADTVQDCEDFFDDPQSNEEKLNSIACPLALIFL